MIPRYSMPEMAGLFSDVARMSKWLQVELLTVEGWAEIGMVPVGDAKTCRDAAPVVDEAFVEQVNEREKVTDHDVAAFVDVVQARIGSPAAAWIHFGLTSSDVVDTSLCSTLVEAADLLIEAQSGLVSALKSRALGESKIAMMGRTHGMNAEPTTFGGKLALWCLQADRDRSRLAAARDQIAVGKLSGAVGTYSNIDPSVESFVCSRMGLRAVPATQVIARDRHAQYLWSIASVGASIECFATEIRHLQRSEVSEVSEPFRAGQKGSSAMPHKRNPIVSERLSGLARLLRGYAGAGLENVALWHERDISHSSVERVALPDASLLGYYCICKMTGLIEGLTVNAERMSANLEMSGGLVFSQAVLLELVRSGMDRDAAYRIVQRDSRRSIEERMPLKKILADDGEVTLTGARLEEIFSLDHALRNTGKVFEALEDIN
ncbi:MAG TPA: adenylosuccinate lyase [Acidimicrobiales bacterium]|nr:adenylosuccinate lyase [Acidimicrobiales bacterium]